MKNESIKAKLARLRACFPKYKLQQEDMNVLVTIEHQLGCEFIGMGNPENVTNRKEFKACIEENITHIKAGFDETIHTLENTLYHSVTKFL